tara:strand:+ start:214 stop:348 length:135 start_codon:yes stop_codon:yes gene_type:complete
MQYVQQQVNTTAAFCALEATKASPCRSCSGYLLVLLVAGKAPEE